MILFTGMASGWYGSIMRANAKHRNIDLVTVGTLLQDDNAKQSLPRHIGDQDFVRTDYARSVSARNRLIAPGGSELSYLVVWHIISFHEGIVPYLVGRRKGK
jgi:hypothetical protein